MTDQPTTYTDKSGVTLTLDAARGWGILDHLSVGITCEFTAPTQIHDLVMFVPTARLLAMIDTEDPDALRSYLRERSDYLDSPDELPIAERRLCDPIPEADSPEDTDEPDPVEQLRESGRQLGAAWRAFTEAWRAFTEGVRAGTFGTDR